MSLSCAICLEPLSNQSVAKTNPCDHLFHFECLNTWTKTSSQCPTCRSWLKEMALESGIRYTIDKKKQSKLDFQPPSPNYFANGVIEEQEESCSRCLDSLLKSSFFICESCDCKLHPMCQDDDCCPNCGWHKFQLVNAPAGKRKAGLSKSSNLDQLENRMYSKIVDELKLKNRENVNSDLEEEDAWLMLDKALKNDVKDSTNGDLENLKNETAIKGESFLEDDTKLKKPNIVTHSLTMDALARHDSSSRGTYQSLLHCEREKKLSYIEKLLIYRLLIKPRVPVDLKPQIYTRVSKKISRSLYDIIMNNKYAMLSMKSVMEYSEREGIILKDKRSIDLLLGQEKESSIIKSFINGDYLKLQLGEKWIQNMIYKEVAKY